MVAAWHEVKARAVEEVSLPQDLAGPRTGCWTD